MHLRVDLRPSGDFPGDYSRDYPDVVIVIDVLRSCTLAPILFSRGLETLYVGPSIRAARHLAEARGLLLFGERGGLPPEGFNYGISPTEVAHADVAGRSAVLVSDNGARVLGCTKNAKHVLLGSLYNAGAAAALAASLAEQEIALLCAGFNGDEDLDDTLCAGFLAAQLKRRLPAASLGGAALYAMGFLGAFPAPVGALWGSRAGHALRRFNLTGDIALSSLVSQTDKVPRLVAPDDDAHYRFTAATP